MSTGQWRGVRERERGLMKREGGKMWSRAVKDGEAEEDRGKREREWEGGEGVRERESAY